MTKEEQLDMFYSFLSKYYKDLIKKYKQFCFLNHMTFDEDVLQETVVKVVDMINKKGLKDESEKGIENYFFQAFKFNTYQQHLQNQKQLKDLNINPFDLEIEDIPYSEENVQYADMAAHYIFQKIKEVFDLVTVRNLEIKIYGNDRQSRIELQEN